MATKDKIVNLEDLKVLSDHVEGEVTDLKSDLNSLEDTVGEVKNTHLELVSGSMNNAGSEYADNARLITPSLVHLESGDKLSVDESLLQFMCNRYNESGVFQESITQNGYTIYPLTIPQDGYYKFCLRLRNDTSADISGRIDEISSKTTLTYVNPRTGIFEDMSEIVSNVNELAQTVEINSDIINNAVKRVVSDAETVLTISKSEATQNIINYDGSEISSSSIYHYSLSVNEGEVISVKRFYYTSSYVPSSITAQKIVAVCAKNGETIVSAKGRSYNANADTYTVPSGIDNIIISFTFSGALDHAFITKAVPNGQIDYYPVQTVFESPCRFSGILTANQFQKIGDFISVDNYVLTCNAKIGSGFTSLKIGGCNAGGTAITAPYVEVTPTQLKMYSNTDSSYNRTETHGLTIANDLQVFVISNKGSLASRIILQSNGQRWESEQTWRLGSVYYGYGAISETNISSFSASVSVIDLFKPVWVCGDSWVTFFDARWYGQAIALNLVDFLHSGHSGEGSKDGLVHLKTLLSMHTPKMIVWLYGMNDADTDSTTPNANWTAALNELKTICENRTIELVLATIPTTPTRNMNAKNTVVVASGYRYVDEVAAMGADDSGNWIAGYQSSDGNHTTEAGARALLAQVIADVPEICIK